MSELTIAFFGDVVGAPGRDAFAGAARWAREQRGAHLVIVNGENAKHGSGLSSENLRELLQAGADAVTLGDHCFRERSVRPSLEDEDAPVAIPANLPVAAPGRRRILLPGDASRPPVGVVTVLGRLYMKLAADDPFAAVDREVGALPDGALAVVEVHSETTSEKQAMAHHCARRWASRVVAVVGTHTHVQTSDARLVEHRLAAITDVGMCGGHAGVIGRRADDALRFMITQSPTVLEVESGDNRADGVLIRIDADEGRALAIQAVSLPAER